MKKLIVLFSLCSLSFVSFCQSEEQDDFFMGYSIKSDSNQSVNNVKLLTNDSIKKAFYNYTGVKIKDDIKYGRYGMDISKWNGNIEWAKVKLDTLPDKLYFVIAKATQGVSLTDKRFTDNFKNAKSNGYLTGAYHFYNQKEDPSLQAENFIKNVKLEKGDLMPVLDVEKNCFSNCESTPDLLISKTELVQNLKIYIKKVEDHFKTNVIIYTGEAFYNDYLSDDFKDMFFWVARYNINPPKCFQVGDVFSFDNPCYKNTKKGCWQYTQWGKVKGIVTNVDLNFINNYYLLKWTIK